MINQLLAGVHSAGGEAWAGFTDGTRRDRGISREFLDVREPGAAYSGRRLYPRSSVEIFVKDLGIIQDMAREERFPVPIAAAAFQMYLATASASMGADDDASLARLYTQLSGVELPGQPT